MNFQPGLFWPTKTTYPGIDSEESISPAYVACRAGTTNRVVVPAPQPENRFLSSMKGLQIRALAGRYDNPIPTWCLAPIDFLKIPELEFLKSLWGLGTEQEQGYCTGPPGYIVWRNSFLGIDSGAPYTFKNTSSQSMGARHRGGIGFLYRPADYIGWRNSFLGINSGAP